LVEVTSQKPDANSSRDFVRCNLCEANDAERLFEKHGDTYVRCRRCGLLYLDPQPSEAELSQIYGSRYYDAWGIGDEDAEASVARLKRKTSAGLLERLTRQTGIRDGDLLDLGCATGFLLQEARLKGFEPWGIELNPVSAKRAAESVGADRIHCGTFDDQPFAGRKFRVVVMSDLLEHVRSPRALLARTRTRMESGAALVIVAPNSAGLSRRLLGSRWTDFKREHLYSFDRSTLPALLERESFRVESVRGFPKYLDLAYVDRQLSTYPTPFFTPLVRMLRRLAPAPLAGLPVPLFAGSMIAIARAT
jgi:SAM-dependent methyltransferase